MERFATASLADINVLKEKAKNDNTEKSTNNWVNTYRTWASSRGVLLNLEDQPVIELNNTLQLFYAELKKKDGKDYEPTSLASMQAALDRYLKDNNYAFSILTDRAFKGSRDVLEGKARILRQNGMGKKPNKASSLTKPEEEVFWECGQLGTHSPQTLINTLWFLFTQHFGFRGRQEHHSMQIQDFTFKFDDEGNEFITFAEGITKTRQSGLRERNRLVIPKMFENKTARCPVAIFKLFISKRPVDLQHNGPFYLAIIYNPTTNIWFKKSPMGSNTINNIMKNMKLNSPLQNSTKKLTNHSARKTLVKKLKKAQVPRSEIVGITGHSSEAGLDDYDSGDEFQQRQISFAIDGAIKTKTHPSVVTQSSNVFPQSSTTVSHNNNASKPSFNFFPENFWENPSAYCPYMISNSSSTSSNIAPPFYNFNNCSVNINNGSARRTSTITSTKKRAMVIYSDSSDNEQ